MFISSKELSPRDAAGKSQNSHLRNRINSIRIPDESKTCDESENNTNPKNQEKEEIKDQQSAENIQTIQQKLLKEFELMKEPSVNPLDVLKHNLKTEIKPKNTKEPKETREHSEHFSSSLYDMILHDVFENMFTPRVNVDNLREKDRKENETNSIEKNKSKIIEISESESEGDKEQDISDDSNYSVLKIPTDSKSVQKYVQEILENIEETM